MNKQFLYILIAFISGYTINNIGSYIIKPAYAYCECNEYDFNFSSSDIYDFKSAVEDIIEDCRVDEYGRISC